MAEYYGRLQGNRGEATRMGTAGSGIMVAAETWDSRVVTEFTGSPYTESGKIAMVSLCPKHGFSVVRLDFNADAIVKYAEHPHVQTAIKEVENAVIRLNQTCAEVGEFEVGSDA